LPSHILSFDHGTTEIKVCIFDQSGRLTSTSNTPIPQIFPQPGWVEQNAQTLWELTIPAANEALRKANLSWDDIAAIGITNQRETTILWDSTTGNPIYNAIVWQCRRTSSTCDSLRTDELNALIHNKTGLILDPYFSATKIRWILDKVENASSLVKQNRLYFGTVDSWIMWNLSGRQIHATDTSNASRTLLYNIHQQQWDDDLIEMFNIPSTILPSVKTSNAIYGETDRKLTGNQSIPIAGVVGDQQASLFGQKCWEAGTAKGTYGTGAFIVMNLGTSDIISPEGLLTTIACESSGNPCYAIEGSIFTAGSTLEWLEKGLGMINHPEEADTLARSVDSTDGVYFVPAFIGLAAPHWNTNARGVIQGLTQSSGKAQIARAALEAMAYQTKEVINIMQEDAHLSLHELRVDGGVTRSAFLMQFLADMLSIPITRCDDPNITAKGAAYLAGLSTGFWGSTEEVASLNEETETFNPIMDDDQRDTLFDGWVKAVDRTLIHCNKGDGDYV
jgi:glycerol kinase